MQANSPLRELDSFTVDLVGEAGELAAVLASVGTDTSFQAGAQGQLLLAAPFQVRLIGTLPGGELSLGAPSTAVVLDSAF